MFTSVSWRYFIIKWEESEYTFMIQKISLLLKKETRKISLWLIISLWKEKQKDENLILTKIMTLGQSFIVSSSLAKVSQLEWLTTPTNRTPS